MSFSSAHHDPAAPAGRSALIEGLQAGGAVALPTETVPGVGVLAESAGAQERLARLKGADPGRAFTLHLRDQAELRRLVPSPPPGLAAWLDRRLPGPHTVVLPRDWVALPRGIAWSWPTVGLRVPRHPAWEALARDLPGPLLMSSINQAGERPLRGRELRAWLESHPEVLPGLDPGRIRVGKASAVVAFEPLPRLLRGNLAAGEVRPGLRVLVICTGNICRSPLAAALLEQELASAWQVPRADLQELGWVVASAGTFAMPGSPASEHSVTVARERGLEIEHHRAMPLREALRWKWDLVLGMTGRHLEALPRRQPADLFDPRGGEVADPFGGDLELYRVAGKQLEQAAQERVRLWSRWPEAA